MIINDAEGQCVLLDVPLIEHIDGAARGCDCGYTPSTCGAGHFCRWVY